MKRSLIYLLITILLCTFLVSFSFAGFAGGDNENTTWLTICSTEPEIEYEGLWMSIDNNKAINNKEYSAFRRSSTVVFEFEGTGIRWIGSTGPNRGKANVYINGEKVAENVDTYSEDLKNQQIIFEKKSLEEKTHTIKIDPINEKRNESTMPGVSVDAFQYVPTIEKRISLLEDKIDEAKKALLGAPSLPFESGDSLKPYYTEQTKNSLISTIAQSLFAIKRENEDEIIKAKEKLNKGIEEFHENAIFPVIPDLSGNDFHVTLVSGNPVWKEGKFNNGLLIDNDILEIAPEAFPEGDEVTLEFWNYGYEESLTRESQFIYARDENGNRLFNIHLTFSNGNVYFDAGQDGGYDRINTDVKDILSGWNHWAFSKNVETGVMRIYVNGELLIEGTEKNKSFPEAAIMEIGSNHLGIVDELRLWDVARSQEEIEANMNKELSGEEDGLVAYWNFNEIETE